MKGSVNNVDDTARSGSIDYFNWISLLVLTLGVYFFYECYKLYEDIKTLNAYSQLSMTVKNAVPQLHGLDVATVVVAILRTIAIPIIIYCLIQRKQYARILSIIYFVFSIGWILIRYSLEQNVFKNYPTLLPNSLLYNLFISNGVIVVTMIAWSLYLVFSKKVQSMLINN